jgi:hypothetical protein
MPQAGKCVYTVSNVPGKRWCRKPCDPNKTFQLCEEHEALLENRLTAGQLALNQLNVGSNPTSPSNIIGLSSNGRTVPSEGTCLGSNPRRPSKFI